MQYIVKVLAHAFKVAITLQSPGMSASVSYFCNLGTRMTMV